MDRLQCLCCEHPNPVGAHYCNDCGAPLNLKPCPHCGAINERPAMHCHACGGEFAFPFAMHEATLGDAAEPVDVPGPPLRGAKLRDPATLGANRVPIRALLAGLAAAIALSAYYAYRQPLPRVTVAGGEGTYRLGVEATPASSAGGTPPSAFATAASSGDAVAGNDARPAPAAARAVAARSSSSSSRTPKSVAKPNRGKATTALAERPRRAAMGAGNARSVAARSGEASVGDRAGRHPGSPAALVSIAKPKPRPLRDVFIAHCREGEPVSEFCDIRLLAKGN